MEGNTIESYKNLCKIFEMRLKIDKQKGNEISNDIVDNYEKYLMKIDNSYNSIFESELKPLISVESSLEKEEKRLKKLIKLLEDRLEERKILENRYYETTGKKLRGLQMVVSDMELNNKKERLSTVSKCLDTSREIEELEEGIKKLNELLKEEESKKQDYAVKNKILEDELFDSFYEFISSSDYSEITEEKLKEELENITIKVKEAKDTLDITKDSIGSLIDNGIDDDYNSYILEAENDYVVNKEKEIILNIYNIVMHKEEDFKLIVGKREKLKSLIDEEKSLKGNKNELLSFENVLDNQINTIENEKNVLENISNYNGRVKFKKERLVDLKEVLSSVDILAIQREYGIIDTYNNKEEDTENIDNETSDEKEDNVINEVYDPYRIVKIKDYPKTLNVGLAKLKGEAVREKVNKKLNPDLYVKPLRSTPSDINKEENKTEEQGKPEAPVWDLPSDNVKDNSKPVNEVSSMPPIWEEVKPLLNINDQNSVAYWDEVKEENSNIDVDKILNIKPKEPDNLQEKDVENMFWIPVSESKAPSSVFPEINIPIVNTNEENNTGFPDVN